MESFEKIWSKIKEPSETDKGEDMHGKVFEKMSSWKAPWLLVFDNYDDHEAFPN
jgi:hypothetical protein